MKATINKQPDEYNGIITGTIKYSYQRQPGLCEQRGLCCRQFIIPVQFLHVYFVCRATSIKVSLRLRRAILQCNYRRSSARGHVICIYISSNYVTGINLDLTRPSESRDRRSAWKPHGGPIQSMPLLFSQQIVPNYFISIKLVFVRFECSLAHGSTEACDILSLLNITIH